MKLLVLIWRSLAVIALILMILPFAWEKITGDYFMVVSGESMTPTYEIGDVLAVQKPTGDELTRDGLIVVVSMTPGNKDEQYVHRVLSHDATGATLKGDGNKSADPAPVTQDLVMGTPRFALQGGLSDAFRFVESWGGRILTGLFAVPAFLVTWRRRKTDDVDHIDTPLERKAQLA
ncbi:S26 family signal peptidase [Microbacterium sp. ISL-59]|uniref:S26 family signal peptidase n=1 Tax=Microbacterium sp. ISL-59 TaxID=2819159 RepID=UPI001BE56F18|nr:S26 family signal peptidase [Microbacterium sp. ISL-59]MBT2495823.1 S26 family signal peptidase [Microbacterium sp. ISL-59]